MSIPRYAARIDGNQTEIVRAMEDVGATVVLIKLPVDALVGYAGKTALFEFKNPATRYGRKDPVSTRPWRWAT